MLLFRQNKEKIKEKYRSLTNNPAIVRQVLSLLVEHSDGRKDEHAVLVEGLDRRHLRQSVNATFHLFKEAYPDTKLSQRTFARIVREWNSQYKSYFKVRKYSDSSQLICMTCLNMKLQCVGMGIPMVKVDEALEAAELSAAELLAAADTDSCDNHGPTLDFQLRLLKTLSVYIEKLAAIVKFSSYEATEDGKGRRRVRVEVSRRDAVKILMNRVLGVNDKRHLTKGFPVALRRIGYAHHRDHVSEMRANRDKLTKPQITGECISCFDQATNFPIRDPIGSAKGKGKFITAMGSDICRIGYPEHQAEFWKEVIKNGTFRMEMLSRIPIGDPVFDYFEIGFFFFGDEGDKQSAQLVQFGLHYVADQLDPYIETLVRFEDGGPKDNKNALRMGSIAVTQDSKILRDKSLEIRNTPADHSKQIADTYHNIERLTCIASRYLVLPVCAYEPDLQGRITCV